MTTSPSLLDPVVPYARRRNTPAQLDALNQLFDTTPHPTRTQRQALAIEIGMELKSVTNWFQNRRQTTRRKSLSFNENNPPSRYQHSRLDRSKISLDRIATLSERPTSTLQLNATRSPLTPRKSNLQQKSPELWTHMLSSPAIPPSSPGPEEARLATLSSRVKLLYPLEWACFQARQKKWVDEDADDPVLEHYREEEKADSNPSSLNGSNAPFTRPSRMPQFEDVEAAITLLGFRTRS